MKRRILLVDDDVAVALTLKTVLEMHGFEVETANSVPDAVAHLTASKYQMVITDMRMESEHSGYEVVRAARDQKYRPAIAILTAYPPVDSDWRNQGAQSLLVKPVGTKDLIRQVEALLVNHEDRKLREPSSTSPTFTPADISSEPRRNRKAS